MVPIRLILKNDFASKHNTKCFDRLEWLGKLKKRCFDFITPYEDFNLKEIASMQIKKM
jgi:hypothetical protein